MQVFVIQMSTGNGYKTSRTRYTPTHAIMFLSVGNDQVICFLNSIAGHSKPKLLSECITGDKTPIALKIANQQFDLLRIFDVIFIFDV